MAMAVMPESLRYRGQGERRGMRALSVGQGFAWPMQARVSRSHSVFDSNGATPL